MWGKMATASCYNYCFLGFFFAYSSYLSIAHLCLYFVILLFSLLMCSNPIHFLLISFVSFFLFILPLTYLLPSQRHGDQCFSIIQWQQGHVTLLLYFPLIITAFLFFLKFSLALSSLTLPIFFFSFFVAWLEYSFFLYYQAIWAPYLNVDCFCPSIHSFTPLFFSLVSMLLWLHF